MVTEIKVEIDIGPLEKLSRDIKGKIGKINEAFDEWRDIYVGEMRRRFLRFSRGSGNWPKLKKPRASGKWPGFILKDTRTLTKAFTIKQKGFRGQLTIVENLDFGIKIGFGSGNHPGGNKPAMVDLAGFHHFGMVRLPARELLVEPGVMSEEKMARVMEKAIGEQYE